MESLPPDGASSQASGKWQLVYLCERWLWASLEGVPFGDRLKGFTSPGRRSHEKALVKEERLEEALTENA